MIENTVNRLDEFSKNDLYDGVGQERVYGKT